MNFKEAQEMLKGLMIDFSMYEDYDEIVQAMRIVYMSAELFHGKLVPQVIQAAAKQKHTENYNMLYGVPFTELGLEQDKIQEQIKQIRGE